MFRKVSFSGFSAIPHLEGTDLCRAFPDGIVFSQEKPNVIVGGNGSGKTSLMSALALKTLSYFVGWTALDTGFTRRGNADKMWKAPSWRKDDAEFLPGMNVDWEPGCALFFRPNHIPGNEGTVANSMFSYGETARTYGNDVRGKSSGQGNAIRMKKVLSALRGETESFACGTENWNEGFSLRDMSQVRFPNDFEIYAEFLKKEYGNLRSDRPIILMDEPEQSLDVLAQIELWKAIENADCSKMQVIVATHNLHPFLHPERFNIIEATAGYVDCVRNLLD